MVNFDIDFKEELSNIRVDKNTVLTVFSSTPFEMSHKNVIYFESLEEQDYYFDNDSDITVLYKGSDFQFLPESGDVKLKGTLDKWEKAQYLRFKNENTRFTIYAFVTNVNYINSDTVSLQYEVDTFNTYQFYMFNNNNELYGLIDTVTKEPYAKNLTPNHVDENYYNIELTAQGFANTQKTIDYMSPLDDDIQFIVGVFKNSFRLNSNPTLNSHVGAYLPNYTPFLYLVVPVIKKDNLLIPVDFEYNYQFYSNNGKTVADIIDLLTNRYDKEKGENTVNQCVALYYTQHIGYDYTYDKSNNRVKFYNTYGMLPTKINSKSVTEEVRTDSGSNLVKTDKVLSYGNYILNSENLNQILQACYEKGILPSFIISQTYYESNWGNSTVGKVDNNWSGIKYVGSTYNGVPTTLGTSVTEYGHTSNYARFQTLTDYFKAYFTLLTNGGYQVVGKSFADSIKGLFKPVARYNYAEVGYNQYLRTMDSVRNGINDRNNNLLNELDQQFLNRTTSNQNKFVYPLQTSGTVMTSDYGSRVLPNGQSDFHWGIDFDDGKKGSPILSVMDGKVVKIIDDATNGKGVIIYHKTVDLTTKYWHLSSYNVRVGMEVKQGQEIGRKGATGFAFGEHLHFEVNKGGWDSNSLWSTDRNVRVDPKPYFQNFTSTSGTINTYTYESYDFAVLNVLNGGNESSYIKLPNLFELAMFHVKQKLKAVGYNKKINSQLLHSEFVNIRLTDGIGNNFNVQLEKLRTNRLENNYLKVFGSVGLSNNVHYTLVDYINQDNRSEIQLQTGFRDNRPKNITIQHDYITTYMQQNANQVDSNLKSLQENRNLLEKQIAQQEARVKLTNVETMYQAKYALESSGINQTLGGLDFLGNLLRLNLGGMFNSGVNWYQSGRSHGFNRQMVNFTGERNSLRSQQFTLMNLENRQRLEQQERLYKSSLSDKMNISDVVTSMGIDYNLETSNGFNKLLLVLEIVDVNALNK